jgi:hypothetical protein
MPDAKVKVRKKVLLVWYLVPADPRSGKKGNYLTGARH